MNNSLLVLILLAATIPAQGLEWWTGTWEEATEEARKRNVPIIVAFVMDNEEANDRIVKGLHKDPAFIKATKRAIAVLACPNTHKPVERKVYGKSTRVCNKFGHVKCEVHKKLEMEVRALFWPTGRVATPTHFVVLPDETKVETLRDVLPTDAYVGALKRGRSKLGGRGLTHKEYVQAQALLKKTKAALASGDYLLTGTSLKELRKMTKGTPLDEEAVQLSTTLSEEGARIATRAEAAAAAGDWVEALRLVRDGAAAFRGTDLHKTLKKTESKLSKTKDGRAAVRVLKAEDRARPNFEKAEKHEKERDYVKAVRAYYRVLNMAAGSPLAARARARLDALKADQDVVALVGKIMAAQDAEIELKAARRLLRQRKKDEAHAKLASIVERWPTTPAAAKARKLLGSDG